MSGNLQVNGGNLSSGSVTAPALNSTWSVVGHGDFNGDGQSDLLWSNSTTNETAIWLMREGHYWQTRSLGANPGYTVTGLGNLSYKAGGVGDFNGDGQSDILWVKPFYSYDDADGAIIWTMANGNHAGNIAPATNQHQQYWYLAGNAYIAGVADFNGDGFSDFVFSTLKIPHSEINFVSPSGTVDILEIRATYETYARPRQEVYIYTVTSIMTDMPIPSHNTLRTSAREPGCLSCKMV